jgi:hypothetical protein
MEMKLRLQKQTIAHDSTTGRNGNCFAAALASIIGIDVQNVPHFYEDASSDSSGIDAVIAKWIGQWLAGIGLMKISTLVQADSLNEVIDTIEELQSFPGYPVLVSGTTSAGVAHVVIVKDGAVLWDPSTSNAGLAGPIVEGFWLIEWIVQKGDF